jgi:hypothetical protein
MSIKKTEIEVENIEVEKCKLQGQNVKLMGQHVVLIIQRDCMTKFLKMRWTIDVDRLRWGDA